jgi:hypothetical protein
MGVVARALSLSDKWACKRRFTLCVAIPGPRNGPAIFSPKEVSLREFAISCRQISVSGGFQFAGE